MNALHEQLDREASMYADALLARLRESREIEQQHEQELTEAAMFASRLAAENAELRARLTYLESLIVSSP